MNKTFSVVGPQTNSLTLQIINSKISDFFECFDYYFACISVWLIMRNNVIYKYFI